MDMDELDLTSAEAKATCKEIQDWVQALGARIIEPPTKHHWGAVNMCFYDPDNNLIYFRQFRDGEE